MGDAARNRSEMDGVATDAGSSEVVAVRGTLPEDADAVLHARAVVAASGSSFYWAMRLLRGRRRRAMYAIYAFCREVDDVADGDAPDGEKKRRLESWRAEIEEIYGGGRPTEPAARALCAPVAEFGLKRDDFLAVIDGMTMDIGPTGRAPPLAELELYCRRVAGAVGLLAVRVFGVASPRAEDFALALGTALQLTNILRDLREDAALGRLYLPRELLVEAGIDRLPPQAVLAHPMLPRVCAGLVGRARACFGDAATALADCPVRSLRPAVVMMMSYRRLLDGLERRGWNRLDQRVVLSGPARLWLVLRYGLLPHRPDPVGAIG